MKLLLENWRKFLTEGFADDIIGTLEKELGDKKKQPGRATQAAAWKENPPSTEADWEKFKRWKFDLESEDHNVPSPEEYEKAKQQRDENKPKETLEYNCNKMYKFLLDYEWRKIGRFGCRSLGEATQGLDPGAGSPSQVFAQSKFVKVVGEGAYGTAMLFNNGHIVKVFKGGIHGEGRGTTNLDALQAELKVYAKLLNSQFGGIAKSYDMSVYEYGTIPVYVPNAERDMLDPVEYIGYAEIGKVIPFSSWAKDGLEGDHADYLEQFFSNDIYDGLATAGSRSKTRRGYGQKLERHHIKSFDQVEGGAEQYADYVIKWIKNRGLENNSDYVQKYGWAGVYGDHPKGEQDPLAIPPMPGVLYSGKGAKFLKDFMIALYDLAKSSGGEYLYGHETRDVHTGNFGISYQTGEVIIFDR